MIDEECGDSRETIIIYFSLLYFFRIDFDAFGWERIGWSLTNTDIKTECLNKVLRHAVSSWRAPYWKPVWFVPKTILKAIDPGLRQHGPSGDE
jgi:hypothetical protein